MPPLSPPPRPTPTPALGAAPLVDAGLDVALGAPSSVREARRGALLMVVSALGFSIMSLLVKALSAELPAMEIVFARSVIMGAVTFAMMRYYGVSVWGVRRGLLASRGLVGAAAMSLLYIILGRMPLGDATTLHYTAPIWTAILAAVFLGERLRPVVFAGTALCLVGVGLVAQPSFLFGSGAEALDPGMVALALAGAVLSGFAYTFVRKLRTTDHPLTIVFYLALGGVVLSVPFPSGWQWPSLWAWAALAGIGASTQIAQLALTKGLHLLEAGPATAIGYLQIVFAFGWGVLFFGEVPDGLSLFGALVIVSSLLLVVRRPKASPGLPEASAETLPEALEASPVGAEALEASPAAR